MIHKIHLTCIHHYITVVNCKASCAIVLSCCYFLQERIPNVISFIMSLPSDKSRPFLIISTSSFLYQWDEEFLRLEPATDVVVYSGSKEIRNSIRNLEFYEEGGCVMFQVLITSPEVVSKVYASFCDKI